MLETLSNVRHSEPLWRHSSWRIGGPADYFIEPSNQAELQDAIQFARQRELPWLIIGQGSNLLFADAGYRGVVIKIGLCFRRVTAEGNEIEAEAGILVCRLARISCQAGLSGIEHVVGIPGTLGGLIVMNGGSQRKSIGDCLLWVDSLDERGNLKRLQPNECGFAYRTSRFQSESLVLLRARIRLEHRPRQAIRREMLQILRERRRKFPRKLPNCGSVFKSSPELYALAGPPGQIIEALGFKGYRVGDAQVSPIHANFIVNVGRARAADMLAVIRTVREAVHSRTQIWMEAEVKYVHPDGRVVVADDPGCLQRNVMQGATGPLATTQSS